MALTNAYTSLARFKTFIGIDDANDDDRIEIAINAASRQIDAHCGQRFGVDATVQVRTFYSDGCAVLEIDPVSTVTGLIVKTDTDYNGTYETTLTINTDFIVEPVNALQMYPVVPYTSLRINTASSSAYFPASAYNLPTVQVTAKFGWPAVPEDVEMACLQQSRQLYKSADATFGAFSLGDSGISMRVRKMDQVAEGLLEPYRRVEC
jgi:hypothetical protein